MGCPYFELWLFIHLFICDTGDWAQGFALAKQELYHLSHTYNPFRFAEQETAVFSAHFLSYPSIIFP
jgi:hypothetical protein